MKAMSLSSFLFLLLGFISFSSEEKAFKLNVHFYFDPISEEPCDHTNFWTPFNQNTTCFRWMMLNANDTEDDTTLPLILDHNVAVDTYQNINDQYKILKVKWKRYTGNFTTPSKDLFWKLNQFESEPTLQKEVSPYFNIGELVMNSYWVINGIETNCYGYWLDKTYLLDPTYAYTFTEVGNSALIKTSEKRGIRPVITMKKSDLPNYIPDAIIIDDLIDNEKLYKYPYEDVKHGGVIYKQLQAFSVTKNYLTYTSSNGKNPDYCMIYSYGGENYSTLIASKYDTCGHGNGVAYNTITDKTLVCGPNSYNEVYQYDSNDLSFEATYKVGDGYPFFNGIGYNEDKNYYLGYNTLRKMFFANTTKGWKIEYAFNFPMFETTQDIEWHDGYIFMPVYDGGCPTTYQIYSFWGKGHGVVYVYDAHFDKDGKPTKDFGRLIARLLFDKKGEIESISFRNGKAYFGYACTGIDPENPFHFFEVDYEDLKKTFIKGTKEGKTQIKFLEQ